MSTNKEDTVLISYCGLYCGDCHAYTGTVSRLAKELRKELRKTEYDKFAKYMSKYPSGKDFKYFDECYKVLGAMIGFQCEKGCRLGGGSSSCKIRQCCLEKNIEGCWQCNEFEKCKKLDALTPVHGQAQIKNLRTIQKKGKAELQKGNRLWYE